MPRWLRPSRAGANPSSSPNYSPEQARSLAARLGFSHAATPSAVASGRESLLLGQPPSSEQARSLAARLGFSHAATPSAVASGSESLLLRQTPHQTRLVGRRLRRG